MKRIGIIGTRRRDGIEDLNKTKKVFADLYEPGDWIVSGGCPQGGDRFAVFLHKQYKTPYLEFPADWKTFGKSAGFVRNIEIAKWSDVLIAVISPARTGGTEDTIKKFLEYKEKRHLLYLVK